jgi:hypothetical protein
MRRVTHRNRALVRPLPGAVAALAVFCSVPGAALAADPGETGAAFLKIGAGARAAGMGDAYSAVAQHSTATYWNPAGIASITGDEIHATHAEWISDVRYEYLAGVHGMKGHAIGFQVGLLHMGTLDGRDASGNFTESFRAYDTMAGVSYAYRPLRSMELGVTAKVIYQKIQDYSAVGFAGDIGIRYRSPVRGLVFAATATNFGTSMKFVDDEFTLPFQIRGGVAFRTRKVLSGLILSSDLRFPNDSDAKVHFGAELWPHEMIALRGGLKLGYDEEAGALGFGVKYQNFLFDYAFVPFSSSSELGDTHRVSFGWRPGSPATHSASPHGEDS